MLLKSTRGIQQEEVWAAADALLAEQLRPTIERVRMKIGRGSPNTVSPMLEAWFATLGSRLGVAPGIEKGSAPEPVRKAMAGLWKVALATAREQADQTLADARQRLDEERTALQAAQIDLGHQQEALTQRERAQQETLMLAKVQLGELATHANQLQGMLEQRDQALAETRRSLEKLVEEREADRRRYDEQARGQAEDRSRAEKRAAATERRLLEDADRSRQEVKQARAALADADRRHEAMRKEWEAANQTLGRKFHDAELEVASLRERMVAAEARAVDLQRLLQDQTLATNAAINRFNQLTGKAGGHKDAASSGKRTAPRSKA